jgi:hypothetical protein
VDLNLLEKTTFWVEDLELAGADLGGLGSAAAGALGLAEGEVMVVDVRDHLVAFDVLRPSVRAESITGKEADLLGRLAAVKGVRLGPRAAVHSEGVLGFIALDPASGAEVLAGAETLAAGVREKVARRALVFASGTEVRDRRIRDTNSPYLLESLTGAGFSAQFGGVLEDDLPWVVSRLEDALGRGFGLVVTTGGVGAEDKDVNVEAVLRLDPGAHTPWILRFTPDMRRHHKEGVRIAVGRVGPTLLVALPGPHDEVRLAGEVMLRALGDGASDAGLAEGLAAALRRRWQEKMHHPQGRHP